MNFSAPGKRTARRLPNSADLGSNVIVNVKSAGDNTTDPQGGEPWRKVQSAQEIWPVLAGCGGPQDLAREASTHSCATYHDDSCVLSTGASPRGWRIGQQSDYERLEWPAAAKNQLVGRYALSGGHAAKFEC